MAAARCLRSRRRAGKLDRMTQSVRPDFDPVLAQAIGFDRTDLEANQRGVLSLVQIDAVRGEHASMGSQSRVAAIVMGVLFLVLGGGSVIGASKEGAEVAVKVALVFLVVGTIAVVANWIHSRRTRGSGPNLRVHVVEGEIRCREDGDTHRVDVEGVKFFVFPTVFAALIDRQRYRIYYVEHPFAHWRRPISAERLA